MRILSVKPVRCFGLFSLMLASLSASVASAQNIHQAVQSQDFEQVKTLLEKDKSLVNSKMRGNGYTPLHYAASNGNSKIVDYLIEKSADVNMKDRYGRLPLHLAAMQGKTEVLDSLLKHKSNIDAANNNGATPLMVAIQYRKKRFSSGFSMPELKPTQRMRTPGRRCTMRVITSTFLILNGC